MAAPGGKYFVQDALKTPGKHHESFKALWETKWEAPLKMGVYPFMFGAYQDFEPVAQQLIKKDMKEPYDWDAYAETFFPKAEELVAAAQAAQAEGNKEKASELFLRASAVYRISRFPAPRSEKQRLAWTKGKEAALSGLSLREHPTTEVLIPHTKHAHPSDGPAVPVYYTLPAHASASSKVPLVIIITGLDGYRTELVVWAEGWRRAGCASLVLEIPGTGDNPGAPGDPTSPDRVWNSVFDWIAQQPQIDPASIVCWGFSTGGYYAIRLAHTHAKLLKGVVAQGGGAHHMFDAEWLDASNSLEYPFDLGSTLAHKFGYTDFERFKAEARDKFSLLNDGTLDRPGCARLLLVNGMGDEIFPVDDMLVVMQHGDPKECRLVPDSKHMGEPQAFFIILAWLLKLLDIDSSPGAILSTIPSRPKY